MMNKRVYGVLGISSIMANWNAGFPGYPKTTSDDQTYGSDKALKYPMKKMWENEGKPVIYIKSMCFEEGKKGEVNLIPCTLKERYEQVFGVELKKGGDVREVLRKLFQTIDIKNFGATFTEAGDNISITGAVQIGQGFNKYGGTEPQEQPILSPFRDPKAKEKSKEFEGDEGEEAKNPTLGTKIVSNEAHYFYPFSINPLAYKGYMELGVTERYLESDCEMFKKAALTSVTSFATNSKAGCENGFVLLVETKEDFYLLTLTKYIEFEEGDVNTTTITCAGLFEQVKDKTLSAEIYYNPYTTKVDPEKINGTKYYNILTQKEV